MFTTLIVEDNASQRRLLHRLLAGQFPTMEIAEAEDGESALHQMLGRHVDLVFMDIRLPHGNGLDLTQIVKKAFADAVVCVVTSYDILEYREAAFRNGADYFMVKGDSTGAEVIDLVETLLHPRFVSVVIVSDPLPRRQIGTLLNIHWPDMVVTTASHLAEGLGQVAALKPDLVLIDLGMPGAGAAETAQAIRGRTPRATLVGLADDVPQDAHLRAIQHSMDHCIPLSAMGHTELVTLVNSLYPAQKSL